VDLTPILKPPPSDRGKSLPDAKKGIRFVPGDTTKQSPTKDEELPAKAPRKKLSTKAPRKKISTPLPSVPGSNNNTLRSFQLPAPDTLRSVLRPPNNQDGTPNRENQRENLQQKMQDKEEDQKRAKAFR